MAERYIEIMDTTLRDGEQMANVSYSTSEKINIAKMLLQNVNVNRVELTSARSSHKEKETVQKIVQYLGSSTKFEILGFVDKQKSVDWIYESGVSTMNLLTKGSLKHLEGQLKKTKEEHVKNILSEVEYANKKGIGVNVYLEDWSNGMLSSKDYVIYLIKNIKDAVKRVMLPDTLGVLNPDQSYNFVKELKDMFPDTFFDFHPHNDYGLGVANCLAAIKAGADGLHVTVNGMGERAGNASLEEVIVVLHDFLKGECKTSIREEHLYAASQMVQIYSSIRMASNKPIVGSNVFTQTAGIHADGDKKGNLYENNLLPKRFGREREYALGKLSGKANLEQNLDKMGIDLSDEEKAKVLERIIELGDKKQIITTDDLPYIIADVIDSKEIQKVFKIKSCIITSSLNLHPSASIAVEYKGQIVEAYGTGDGGYDAFIKALKDASKKLKIEIPELIDYNLHIPPGGHTDALVQVDIVWGTKKKRLKTKGVHCDQVLAAVEATEKMVNSILS